MDNINENIRNLISVGNLREALNLAELHLKANKNNKLKDVILLKSRFENNEQDYSIKHIISLEEFHREKNKITNALLLLSLERENKHIDKYKHYYLITGSALIICLIIFFYSNHSQAKKQLIPQPTPFTLTRSDSNNVSQSKSALVMNGFTIEYMRLFGAFGVQPLIQIIETGQPPKGYPYTEEIKDFWLKKWRYKGARVIKSALWNQLNKGTSPNIENAYNLYFTAMPKDSNHFENLQGYVTGEVEPFYYIETEDMSDSLYYAKVDSIKEDLNKEFNDDDIGFLFLIIKNENESIFNEIAFEYMEYQNPLQIFNKKKGDDPGADWDDFLLKKKPESVALTPNRLENGTIKTVKIPNVRPGDTFLWLVAIYKAKRTNGLPAFYISNVIIPKKIYALINQDTSVQLIREPYGEAAARTVVPFGWEGQ